MKGREDVAEIARLCRALLTAWEDADDPDESPVIAQLIHEAGEKHPGRSLQMMAAILVGMARRLRAAYAARGLVADQLIQDEADHRKEIGDPPDLVDACAVIAFVLDASERDQAELNRCVRVAATQFGADALMMLTEMAWQVAHSVVKEAGTYKDVHALLAETAANDERSLYEQGEA